MAENDDKGNKKPRLLEEQVTEIKRLRRLGVSQTEIGKKVGCHRQTVRLHLQEKSADTVAEGARRDVLADALRRHFQQLADFAGSNLRTRLDASLDVYPRRKHRKSRGAGPIIVSGMMALPYGLGATHMCEEWMRMYLLSAKDTQLLRSLRDHTKESPFWTYWDQWRKKVADYDALKELLQRRKGTKALGALYRLLERMYSDSLEADLHMRPPPDLSQLDNVVEKLRDDLLNVLRIPKHTLESENATLREQIQALQHTITLLSTMLRGGI